MPHTVVRMAAIAACLFSASSAMAQFGEEGDEYGRAIETGRDLATLAISGHEWQRMSSDIAKKCGQILVADGDSWFDYPLRPDIVSELEKKQWAVFSAAHYGDTLESIMYNNSQLSAFYRTLADALFLGTIIDYDELYVANCNYNNTISRDSIPKAIILSAGGNDVIVDKLAFLLEHAHSSAIGNNRMNQQIKNGLLYRLERILVEYISAIRHVCRDVSVAYDYDETTCQGIPILIHGYDYAEATGIGYRVLGVTFRGPWIAPALDLKDWSKDDGNKAVGELVDAYNIMLCRVAKQLNVDDSEDNPIFFLDFRNAVGSDWLDEIHPDSDGAERLAGAISQVVLDFHGEKLDHGTACINPDAG